MPQNTAQTARLNAADKPLHELTPLQIVQLMSSEDRRLAPAVSSQNELIALAITVSAERLAAGGRLIFLGAGASGRLGLLEAAECSCTFQTPFNQVTGVMAGGPTAWLQPVDGAGDRPDLAEQDLAQLQVGSRDVLVGISASGRTPYVLGGVIFARRHGAYTIGLSCNPAAELAALVELAITPAVGPEVLPSVTRLKAGTATKMILNMLSTGVLTRLQQLPGKP